jgi:ParB family chromosome partitioning protein
VSKPSDERGTPTYIIEAAQSVMGNIDLDPATCPEAQAVVQAQTFHTKESNGLAHQWQGRVWLNPPYSHPLCQQFITKLLDEYDAGRVTEAIVLVNTSTGKWYHALLERFPVCYPKHHPRHPNARIEFVPLPGNNRGTGNNSGGQALFYLGTNVDRFFDEFSEFCTVPWAMHPSKPPSEP